MTNHYCCLATGLVQRLHVSFVYLLTNLLPLQSSPCFLQLKMAAASQCFLCRSSVVLTSVVRMCAGSRGSSVGGRGVLQEYSVALVGRLDHGTSDNGRPEFLLDEL